jgi:chaperonin GroES
LAAARSERVKVIRGSVIEAAAAPARPPSRGLSGSRRCISADTRLAAVTVVRGSAAAAPRPRHFAVRPASAGELDRVAFAVDGAESSHGADLRMWRPQPNGPQGPMQVSDAAARDVGGGDRFDLRQNRMLGRAYLARMFERYGNWPDALAAYNWGPGNVDAWIAAGRPAEKLPFGVTRYVAKSTARRPDLGPALDRNRISFCPRPFDLISTPDSGSAKAGLLSCEDRRAGVNLRPLHDRVVIRRVDQEQNRRVASSSPIPPRKSRWRARSSPPGRARAARTAPCRPMDLKTGDRVLFGKWSGTEIKIDGEELIIMKESDVMGVFTA